MEIANEDVVGFSITTSAWMSISSEIPRKEQMKLRPSQDPARQEVLLAVTMTIDGRTMMSIANVDRKDGSWVIIDDNTQEDAKTVLLEQVLAGYIEGKRNQVLDILKKLSPEQQQQLSEMAKVSGLKHVDELIKKSNDPDKRS